MRNNKNAESEPADTEALTKRGLVISIAEKMPELTQQQVQRVVQLALDGMAEAMLASRHIEFRDFGVFEVAVRKARIGRNPNRPEDVVRIPERRVIKFKPGKLIRKALLSRGGRS